MGDNEDMPETIDPTLASAVDLARAAAVEAAGGEVGEHLGVVLDDDAIAGGLLASHHFAALEPGYRSWYWSVSVSRVADDDRVTVNDVVLLPGDDAVVAPAWTPYKDRLRPGDLSPGDVLPPEEDDVRLVPAWSAGDGDEQTPDRFFAREVGLGREWVLSIEGREGAADRWYDGEFGPAAPIAQQAAGVCGTCGFLISLAGDLSDRFGVCGNGQANADGRVVSFAHGCGAHSGAKLKRSASQELPPHVLDTITPPELESLAVAAPEVESTEVDAAEEKPFREATEGAEESADDAGSRAVTEPSDSSAETLDSSAETSDSSAEISDSSAAQEAEVAPDAPVEAVVDDGPSDQAEQAGVEQPQDEQPQDEQPQDEQPQDEQPQDEQPQDEQHQDEQPQD